MAIIEYMKRSSMINQLSTAIQGIPCPHPLRVAVDGVDASGKTFLADELVQRLKGGTSANHSGECGWLS